MVQIVQTDDLWDLRGSEVSERRVQKINRSGEKAVPGSAGVCLLKRLPEAGLHCVGKCRVMIPIMVGHQTHNL